MNVLVVCAAGMSSSALVQKLREEVKRQNLDDIKIGSCASGELNRYAVQADIILFAPQLSFMAESFDNRYGARVIVLERREYGIQDTERILKKIRGKETVEAEDETSIRVPSGISRIAERIGTNSFLNIMSGSMTGIFTVSVVGSLLSLIRYLPFDSYEKAMTDTGIGALLESGITLTLGCISLYLCISIASTIAERKGERKTGAVITAIAGFLIVTSPFENRMADLSYFGVRGMFTAILISVVMTYVFFGIRGILPRKRIDILPANVGESFLSLIPLLVCMALSSAVLYMTKTAGFDSLPQLAESIIQKRLVSFAGTSVISHMILEAAACLLWFFGIHGGNIIGTITTPLYMQLALENLNNIQAGLPPQNIVSNAFSSMYDFGGIGSTLVFSFLCAYFAKSKKLRMVGRISLPMGIFFINEPLLFGVPMILNPLMLAPLLGIPFVSCLLTVLGMKAGLLPYAAGYAVPWTTPPLISGLIQGGWRLALWQLILMVIQTALWYPFFIIEDRRECREEQRVSK